MVAYTVSVARFSRHLRRAGMSLGAALGIEAALHGVVAIGVLIGRYGRWNSWDLGLRPVSVVTDSAGYASPRAVVAVMLFAVGIGLIATTLRLAVHGVRELAVGAPRLRHAVIGRGYRRPHDAARPAAGLADAREARRASCPKGDDWSYEPKWDGFRCIVFRDGADVELGSRNERPLTRYFPELLEPLRAALPEQAVVDGEIVIMTEHGLDFDQLSQPHPPGRESHHEARGRDAGRVRRVRPPRARRRRPVRAAVRAPTHRARAAAHAERHRCTSRPRTRDRDEAGRWFEEFEGAGLDGLVVKDVTGTYRPGDRGWLKVKHLRTADCVVAGFRVHKDGKGVGSLLLGLYDDDGALHHVGVASSFAAKLRAELAEELEPLREHALDGHPWADWAEMADGVRRAAAARRGQPLERARRTCRGSRCASSGWPRSRTSTCRATASGTRPGSSAGGPTARPSPAPTSSSTSPCPSPCSRSSAPEPRPE